MANQNGAKRSCKVAANLPTLKSETKVHQHIMKNRKMQRRFSKVGRMFNTPKKQSSSVTSLSKLFLQYPRPVIIEEGFGRKDDTSSCCDDAHRKDAKRDCNSHRGFNIPFIDKFGIPCTKLEFVQTRRVSLDEVSSKDNSVGCIEETDDNSEAISVTKDDSTFEIDCLAATFDCAFASS